MRTLPKSATTSDWRCCPLQRRAKSRLFPCPSPARGLCCWWASPASATRGIAGDEPVDGMDKPPACPPRHRRTKAEEADIWCATKTGQLNSLSTDFVRKITWGSPSEVWPMANGFRSRHPSLPRCCSIRSGRSIDSQAFRAAWRCSAFSAGVAAWSARRQWAKPIE